MYWLLSEILYLSWYVCIYIRISIALSYLYLHLCLYLSHHGFWRPQRGRGWVPKQAEWLTRPPTCCCCIAPWGLAFAPITQLMLVSQRSLVTFWQSNATVWFYSLFSLVSSIHTQKSSFISVNSFLDFNGRKVFWYVYICLLSFCSFFSSLLCLPRMALSTVFGFRVFHSLWEIIKF